MTLKEEVIKRLSTCARCRQCRIVCERPIAKTMLPICPSGEYYKFDSYFASGRITVAKKFLLGEIDFDPSLVRLIYSCTLCGSCKEQCPIIGLDPLEATTVMRELAVEAGLSDNVYPTPSDKPVEYTGPEDQESDTALFVGCEAQSDAATVQTVAQVLKSSGQPLRVLSGCCCGGYLLRKGDRPGFEKRKAESISRFKEMNLKRIIAHDPMCYKVLKEDYALEEQGIEVVYFLEAVVQGLKGEVQPSNGEAKLRVAYHDPCYLGHYMGVYELPRQVITGLGNFDLVEFNRTRENSLCCGGTPDWISAPGEAAAAERIKEAESVGADMVLSTCRNCSGHLDRAARKMGSKVLVKDLLAVLAESVK